MGLHILIARTRKIGHAMALVLLAGSALWAVWSVNSLPPASAGSTDLVFFAAKSFPVDSLTLDEIRNIYLGKKRVVGGSIVVAVDQSEAAPIKLEFLDLVLRLSHAEYKAQLLKRRFQEGAVIPKIEPNAEAVLREVVNTNGSVGYAYQSDIQSNHEIKVLAVLQRN